MRLGVHLPVAGKGASPGIIPQVAVEAERIGLDSSWSWERLMRPRVPIALGGAGGAVRDAPRSILRSRGRAHLVGLDGGKMRLGKTLPEVMVRNVFLSGIVSCLRRSNRSEFRAWTSRGQISRPFWPCMTCLTSMIDN